jgi:phage shock protein E
VRRTPWLVALVAAAALLTGCSGSSSPLSPTTGPTAAAVPATGSSLSPSDFAAAVKLPNTEILDVRTASEFASGHLAGAVNLDVESSGFTTSLANLDPSKNYAVYCRAGNRSKTATSIMKQTGFTSVYDLAGGINAWTSAGGAVVS